MLPFVAERPRHTTAAGVQLDDLVGDEIEEGSGRRHAENRFLVTVPVEHDPARRTLESEPSPLVIRQPDNVFLKRDHRFRH